MGCQDDMGNGLTHETLSLGEFLARGGEQRNVDPAVIIIVGAGGDQQAFQVSSPKDPGKSLVPVRNSAHGMLPLRDPHAQSSIQTRPQLVRPLESPVRARPERIQRLANSDESASSLEEHLLRLLGACRYLKHRAWLILPVAAVGLAVGAASFKYYPPVRAASCMVILHSAPRASPIESDNRQDQSESTQFFVGPERAFKSSENVLSALRHLGIPNASEPFAESIAKRMNLENIGNHAYVAILISTFFGDWSDWYLGFFDVYVKSYVVIEVEKMFKVFVVEVNFLRF